MLKTHSRLFGALILLFFCEQVLALPFLDCCGEMDHGKDDSMGHEMEMPAAADAPITVHSPAMHSHSMAMSSHAENMMVTGHDCGHVCEYCLSPVSSAVMPVTADFPVILVERDSIPGYLCSYHSTVQDNPFRPPIPA